MLLSCLFRSSKPRPISRRNTARLRLEALDERITPSLAEPTIYPVHPGASSLAAADFTGDGILDLATNGAVLVGNGDGSFQPARLSSMPGESLLTGDVDGDGAADLIVTNEWSGSLNVLISNGDGTFQPAQPVTLPTATPPGYFEPYTGEPLPQTLKSSAVGDFNADGLLDLIVLGTTNHNVVNYDPYGPGGLSIVDTFANVLIGTGLGTFDHAATYHVGGDDSYYLPVVEFRGPSVGDFNGDGNLDFLTSTFSGSYDYSYTTLETWLGNGDGAIQSRGWAFSHGFPSAVADFNNDGRTDVLTDVLTGGGAAVALGGADGAFTQLPPFSIGQEASSVVGKLVGDVNGDGILDLVFVKKPSFENAWADVLLGNGDGTFAAPIAHHLGSYGYTSPMLADFDGDGFADLAAADRNLGVVVHMNEGNTSPPPPGLRIDGASVIEGNSGTKTMTFTVTLTHAATGPVTVQYATANGTATAGSDYQAASGTLTFAPGQTQQTINVAVFGDRQYEPDEGIIVNLSNPTGAVIASGSGGGTILNDDMPMPSISISDVTKAEGKKGKATTFTFTVTLSAAYDQPVTMSFQTVNGTATTGDNDFVAKSGTITFKPGETTKTITINVKGDSKKESNETFYLDLFNLSSNALFTKNRGTGTILNDD